MNWTRRILLLLIFFILTGCATRGSQLETVSEVDIERYMGDWYVIAHIPVFIEKNAYNAIESYRLDGDRIETTFSFRNKGFDGPKKEYHPNAIITDPETNAVWGMQFVWPFRADFRIVYLDDDYTTTIIGRNKRDYVWIMARQPEISEQEYERLVRRVDEMGYDTADLRRVPQRW
ncbi:MAG: lipocalin family protein [Wenzhouxiangella sp.]|jgi:apolipoprotein D and lipocalin family protein|nr:lipocalin family protein [Wenzhouxiangella sp.]